MCTPSPSPYSPLPSQTSIRILILEPSSSPDEEITCHLAPIDLDADHALFPSPRPMECPVEFYGSVLPGTRRRKVFQISSDIYIPDDDDFDPLNDPLKLHPFQRYTALSYVWGDPADPCHVFLEGDGTTARFPVTRNLHQALRSLRRSGEGVRLWVDALCINQEDYEEKRVQIALMRRLYRQAEEVVAFVPLAREDSDNVAELVQKIWESRELFLEAQAQREEQGEGVEEAGDAEESEVSLTSWALPEAREPVERVVWEKEDVGTDSEAIGFKYAFGDANGNDSTLYLEGYSLPSAESPLWVSWRRFFSSPYFRRIWILQEFAMAKKLTFDFGHRIMITSKGIMGACAAIKKFSGAKNAEYMRRDADDVPLDEGRQAFTGLQLAWSMFAERLSAEAGLPPKDLATMLHTGRHFLATDPRDKVYAVLGLAEDGGLFAESVRYEPEETHVMTFIRFARLLVEQGHGFQVLLQAGIGGSQARDEGLPSWVPNWVDPVPRSNPASLTTTDDDSPHTQTSNIRFLDNDKLLLRGTIIDEIKVLNDMFPPLPSPQRMSDFMRAVVGAIQLVFENASDSDKSGEERMDTVLSILTRRKSAEADDLPSLRSGFSSFLTWIVGATSSSFELKKNQVMISPLKSSKDFHFFLDRVFAVTAYTRFSETAGGCFGLAPEKAEVGDVVAMFDGCDAAFLLRRAGGDGSYRVVGSGYFEDLNSQENVAPGGGQGVDIILA